MTTDSAPGIGHELADASKAGLTQVGFISEPETP